LAFARILLAAMPRLSRELIERKLREQPDMAVVAFADDERELAAAVRAARPEVVIVGARRISGAPRDLLASNPALRVITIDDDSGQAVLCEGIARDIGAGDVVTAVRRATARPRLLDRGSV
jgi:DNA-binding NarL/FixJ family response regulator